MLDDGLATWCAAALGSPPIATIFETGHLSRVVGYRLQDGREVVLKLRPPDERVLACLDVQMYLFANGYPCPQPLAGPALVSGGLVTAEAYVEPGEAFSGHDAASSFAGALQRMIALTSKTEPRLSLDPPPPWLGWLHRGDALWPDADDLQDDLNAIEMPVADDVARRVASLLKSTTLPRVVGHCDWWPANVQWRNGELHVVHDWDSLAHLPEAALAGGASVLYTSASTASATLAESEAFLAAYEASRGRAWSEEERAVAWAAGLWNLAFDAKKDAVRGGGASLQRLEAEAEARLRLAGV
jgi:hypothetical protein